MCRLGRVGRGPFGIIRCGKHYAPAMYRWDPFRLISLVKENMVWMLPFWDLWPDIFLHFSLIFLFVAFNVGGG